MKLKHILYYLLLLLSVACSSPKNIGTSNQPTEFSAKKHIVFLASDSLKGRFPSTTESKIAAQYIRNQLLSYGYTPLADDGFQYFTLTLSQKLGDACCMSINGTEYQLGVDYTILSISENADIQKKICFAGYGFDVNEGNIKRNDYQNLDVEGKWVMMLLDAPNDSLMVHARYQTKAVVAREKGAAGVLFVAPKGDSPHGELLPFFAREASVGIPCLQITRSLANKLLDERHTTLEIIEKNLINPENIINFDLEVYLSANVDIQKKDATTKNVVMMLQGSDPSLKHESIILGAHYDHLGYGGAGSGSRTPNRHEIHNGADDNASGVGMLLALAEQLAKEKASLKRSIVIVAFGAEEQGIVGSKYFVNNPPAEVGRMVAMLNFDMVGRLNDKRALQVNGTGTFPEAEDFIKRAKNKDSLQLVLSKSGFGPSDHAPFYAKQIPILYFTTGVHPDYHSPEDDAYKINYAGVQSIGLFTEDIVKQLATMPVAPVYQSTGGGEMHSSPTRPFKVTLGIIPDFTSDSSDGMRADVVSEGRPAYKAGMKNGDLIVAINGKAVKNIQDYMLRLSELKAGEIAEVAVKRNNEELTLHIEL